MATWFVTGGAGFIGRAFLHRLATEPAPPALRVMTRPAAPRPATPPRANWSYVEADLLRPESYHSHLRGVDTVIHLAAVTGHAPASAYRMVNVEGTRELVNRARAEGVARFVFVSSVAAGYPDRRFYPYADSKRAAEEIVRTSGLAHLILRPTIVLGPGSPALAGLARLAGGPVLLVPGAGTVMVQPIAVEDVAIALVEAGRSTVVGTITIGGRDRIPMIDLLRAIRGRSKRPDAPTVHLPLTLMRLGLASVERLLGPRLPLGAGQLAVFANASDAPAEAGAAALLTPTFGVEEMLRAG